MLLTQSYLLRFKKLQFVHIKPTSYFLKWYFKNFNTIPALSLQKLPKIKRSLLIKFL
jgi:hypothetical protein